MSKYVILFVTALFFYGLTCFCISDELANKFSLKSNQNSLVNLSRNKLASDIESEKKFEEINKNLIFPQKTRQRDYNAILQKTREMMQTYPESKSTMLLLTSTERWKESDLIDDEQFAFFKKKLDEYKAQDKEGETLIGSINERLHGIDSQSPDAQSSYQKLIKECNDIFLKKDINQQLKYYTLLLLAQIYFKMNDNDEAEKYVNTILDDYKKSRLVIRHRDIIVSEAYELKVNIAFKRNGINAAAEMWKQYIDVYAQNFHDVSNAYRKMIFLLDTLKDNSEKTIKKKLLLEEFISSFPDSKAEPLLDARLSLGYVVLNEHTHSSGNLDTERVRELNEKYKASAAESEKIFNAGLHLAKGTYLEESFVKALDIVKEVQKEKPKQEAGIDKSFLPKYQKNSLDKGKL
ncbi:MAG: hypothetical protein LBP59_01910 [Planctomycetaceae bacterium]|jgi:hypothetical protein|nr:hypothetical protein [Planctomycetaceae bacterium]